MVGGLRRGLDRKQVLQFHARVLTARFNVKFVAERMETSYVPFPHTRSFDT